MYIDKRSLCKASIPGFIFNRAHRAVFGLLAQHEFTCTYTIGMRTVYVKNDAPSYNKYNISAILKALIDSSKWSLNLYSELDVANDTILKYKHNPNNNTLHI